MPNEADLADQTIEIELKAHLAAVRRKTGPQLEPIGVCHNCGERVEYGKLFCAPVGSGLSECQVDYEYRMRRAAK